ncbi:MAG: hypothetical protein ACREP9_19340, partial [Candidatus Dormibacteraceae bacterium]
MASDLSPSDAPGTDSLLGPDAVRVGDRRPPFLSSWRLAAINGMAAAVIIGAVAVRLWEAHLPGEVLQEEALVIGVGILYGAVAVAIRVSRLSNRAPVQLGL